MQMDKGPWGMGRPGSLHQAMDSPAIPAAQYLGLMIWPDFSEIPVLHTRRLVLRELREDDAPAIFRLRSSPDVMRYIPKPLDTRSADSLRMVREFRQAAVAGDAIMWAITVKGSDRLVGYIGYWRILKEHHRAEVGYALHPDLWGQGLASEALAAVLEHGFRVIGLNSVEATVAPGNTASIHVLQRNQFVREGYFRENYRVNGEYVDSLVYSRLAPRGR